MEPTESEDKSFSSQVLKFLERVEHRVATVPADREAAFRLRCQAYRRAGFLESCEIDQIYDPRYDDDPLGLTTMTFVDGELAGTVRINVGFEGHPVLPGLQVYGDVLVRLLSERQLLVEFTRLAADLSLSSVYPHLAYIIMRPAYMAAVHFNADFAIASPRADHVAFYRRTFRAATWCPPRAYPGLTAKFACMVSEFHTARSIIEARYPFYKSTAAEREALFGPAEGVPQRFASEDAPEPLAQLSPCV